MPRTSLRDQTILITGATSGLGRGMALALASGNNRIVATGRRAPLLKTLAEEIEARGSTCMTAAVDATETSAVAAHLDEVYGSVGPIDIAILNAGGAPALRIGSPEATPEAVLRIMDLNYATLVNYLCPLAQRMQERGGIIAHTSSPAGFFGLPTTGGYSAAKAAGRTLLDAARIELTDTPLRFVTLYPGFTYTEGLDPNDVPSEALIIDADRAVREMLRAIERGRSHAIFPKRIAWPIRMGRLLPEPIRRRLLAWAA